MNWTSIFGLLTSVVDFCKELVKGKSDIDETVDATAARSGTAAGAAASHASKIVGPK